MDHHRDLSGKALLEDLQFFRDRIRAFFRFRNMESPLGADQNGWICPMVRFLGSAGSDHSASDRYRIILKRIEERCEGPKWYYRRLGLFLLRRSLPLLGMTLLFGFYSSAQFSLLNIDLGRFLFYVFLVLLMTRWGLDYLNRGFRGPRPTCGLSYPVTSAFFSVLPAAIIVALVLFWIAGRDSLLAWMARAFVSAVLLAWAVFSGGG